jgi:hypothetical protein
MDAAADKRLAQARWRGARRCHCYVAPAEQRIDKVSQVHFYKDRSSFPPTKTRQTIKSSPFLYKQQ